MYLYQFTYKLDLDLGNGSCSEPGDCLYIKQNNFYILMLVQWKIK